MTLDEGTASVESEAGGTTSFHLVFPKKERRDEAFNHADAFHAANHVFGDRPDESRDGVSYDKRVTMTTATKLNILPLGRSIARRQ